MKNLLKLQLSQNELSFLTANLFENLFSLKELCLYTNDIKRVDEDTFASLKSLNIIQLQTNQINDMPKTVFQHLIELKSLYLSQNKFNSMNLDLPINLDEFDISYNQISTLTLVNSFKSLTSMKIKSNKMDDFKFVKHLQLVTNLDLSQNRLVKIPQNELVNLKSLQILNLSRNYLDGFDAEPFFGL